jgi:hypothetical protein
MKTPERAWLALLLLLSCSAVMMTLCALVSSGRSLAVATGIDLNAGTLLNASPCKVALLLHLGLFLSAICSVFSAWLMRAERRWIASSALLDVPPVLSSVKD